MLKLPDFWQHGRVERGDLPDWLGQEDQDICSILIELFVVRRRGYLGLRTNSVDIASIITIARRLYPTISPYKRADLIQRVFAEALPQHLPSKDQEAILPYFGLDWEMQIVLGGETNFFDKKPSVRRSIVGTKVFYQGYSDFRSAKGEERQFLVRVAGSVRKLEIAHASPAQEEDAPAARDVGQHIHQTAEGRQAQTRRSLPIWADDSLIRELRILVEETASPTALAKCYAWLQLLAQVLVGNNQSHVQVRLLRRVLEAVVDRAYGTIKVRPRDVTASKVLAAGALMGLITEPPQGYDRTPTQMTREVSYSREVRQQLAGEWMLPPLQSTRSVRTHQEDYLECFRQAALDWLGDGAVISSPATPLGGYRTDTSSASTGANAASILKKELAHLTKGYGVRRIDLGSALGSNLRQLWSVAPSNNPQAIRAEVRWQLKRLIAYLPDDKSRLVARVAFNIADVAEVEQSTLVRRYEWLSHCSPQRLSPRTARRYSDRILSEFARSLSTTPPPPAPELQPKELDETSAGEGTSPQVNGLGEPKIG